MFNRLFLFFCFFLSSFAVYSQTLIKGRTLDQKGILSTVNISLINQRDTILISRAVSDSLGNFELKNIPNGKYILSFQLIGYQKNNLPVNVIDTEEKILALGEIYLIENYNVLNTVTITGGVSNFNTQNGNLKVGVANNDFFKASSNLLDVFKKLPGLQVNQDGTMQLASRATPTLFVDGRPVNMNNDEIQAYLASLSPDMVESIEMINQPSSKYDGEYQGIIDVKLKRNLSMGLKGNYNGRFQRNKYSLLDNNISLVYKSPRLVYDLKLGHTAGSTFYKYHALQFLANTNAMITDTRTVTGNQNFNAQARVTYEMKKGQNLEAFARTYQMDRNAVSGNYLFTQNNNLTHTISTVRSDNNALPKQISYAGGLNYDGVFKKSELHIITSFAQVDNIQTEDIQNRNVTTDALQNYWKTNSENRISIRTLQADYLRNTNLGTIEFGARYAYTSTQNNLRYDTLGNTIFSMDPARSNQFHYDEYISAGYLSYQGQWKKFNYNASFRAERTYSRANSLTTGLVTERNYIKWLPSLSITYAITKNEQLNFSFSRRLTRPTFAALNPFRFYYSPRHYWIGNPYLQPSTTNLFAFSYSLRTFNVSLNAGRETDVISRYPEYNPATNELIFLGRNQPYRNFANLQLTSPITLTKWWRMNTTIGLYYNRELTPYFGNTYKIPIYNYTINGSQIFTVKDWLFDASYVYESRSGNGLYHFMPVYGIDFGVQKSSLKKKINTKLTLYDAFDTIKRRLIFREKSIINNDFYHYFATNRLVFSLTYSFGSSNYKAKESKKSDEENRAN